MTRRNLPLLIAALVMMGTTAGLLLKLREKQRLSPPAIRTSPIEDSIRLKVDLPELVLDYTSEWVEPDELVLKTLPQDTSFGHRVYRASDGFEISMNAVLMGTDRTSIHKPQICLSGFGWQLDDTPSIESSITIDRPTRWELPVARLIGTKQITANGNPVTARCVYVYWFVAENRHTARHWERMWWMARDLVTTGVLQRWAYISCLAVCPPGQEERVYERIKTFVAAAVPEFDLTHAGTGGIQRTASSATENSGMH